MKNSILLLIFASNTLLGLTIGSNTSVSISSSAFFPQNEDNNILGFVAMQNGFTLQNMKTTCTYDNFFPIDNDIFLNRGTYVLNQDCVCGPLINFRTLGTVIGNQNKIDCIGKQLLVLAGNSVELSYLNALTLSRTINSIDFAKTGTFFAAGINTGIGNELFVYNYFNNQFTLLNSLDTNTVNCLKWHPTKPYLAVGFANNTQFIIYEFNTVTYSLTARASRTYSRPVNSLAWTNNGAYLALQEGTTVSSALYMYQFIESPFGFFDVTSTPTLPGINASIEKISWDPTGQYLSTGYITNTSTELRVYAFDGVSLSLNNQVAEVGVDVRSTAWHPTLPLIAVGLGAGSTQRLRLYAFTPNSPLLFINDSFEPEGTTVNTIVWQQDGEALAIGFLNTTTGFGEFRLYSFDVQSYSAKVIPGTVFQFLPPVNDISWSADGLTVCYSAGLSAYFYQYSLTNNFKYIFQDIKLVFNGPVQVSNHLNFRGNCSINCNGFPIQIDSDIRMSIDPGSSLTIMNASIITDNPDAVVGLSSLSNLILNNVNIVMSEGFTFSTGQLVCQKNVLFTGSGQFTFSSDQPLYISENSALIFDDGITFYYAPSINNRVLIQFANSTASIRFKDSLLLTSAIGLNFLKGTIVLEGTLVAQAEGGASIVFGDGLSALNDANLSFLTSGQLIASNSIIYQNVG